MAKKPLCTCAVCGRKAPKEKVPDYQIGWAEGEQCAYDRPLYCYKRVPPRGWQTVHRKVVCDHPECVAALTRYQDRLQEWERELRVAGEAAVVLHRKEIKILKETLQGLQTQVKGASKAARDAWEQDNPKPTLETS